jgi:hypothetical protein
MDEYFVTAQPQHPSLEGPPLSREDVAALDLSGLHAPTRVPWTLFVAGRLMIGLIVLGVAAVPVLLLVGVFRFLDSLPF